MAIASGYIQFFIKPIVQMSTEAAFLLVIGRLADIRFPTKCTVIATPQSHL